MAVEIIGKCDGRRLGQLAPIPRCTVQRAVAPEATEDYVAWWELLPLADFLINRESLYVLSIEPVGGSQKKRVLSRAFKTPGDLMADGD